MLPIFTQPRQRQIHRRSLLMPEVWPLSIALLVLLRFCLTTGQIKALEPSVDLPTSSGFICIPESEYYDITINKYHKLFFSIRDEPYRTAIIEQVAALHGVMFTSSQRQELRRMPYMGIDVRRLPEYFAASRAQRYTLLKTGIPASQLGEYIDATRSTYMKRAGKSSFCFLRADKKTSFAAVKPIMHLLQQRKIKHFNIRTNNEY
ncbi:biopolymer transporter ExbD [Hymenobacter sp. BT186]|uniref:Biopolymer transporter ExbD n=1 Tax=Hymenobacter telluris TaxID=2816474 RepID=A0A939EZI2_9BACT|nr:biopolymer transporter ExbD [Hymenobacter telluris]MBO0360049.1 biopolymer transporter ExbD [Hymenobacter telluris]MBW3376076.1 biopolymer transporter ExbD [Hymenobacter norwichensis]